MVLPLVPYHGTTLVHVYGPYGTRVRTMVLEYVLELPGTGTRVRTRIPFVGMVVHCKICTMVWHTIGTYVRTRVLPLVLIAGTMVASYPSRATTVCIA